MPQRSKHRSAAGNCRESSVCTASHSRDDFHEDVVHAYEAGMNGHLVKPIDPKLLYQTLAEVWKKRGL